MVWVEEDRLEIGGNGGGGGGGRDRKMEGRWRGKRGGGGKREGER